MNEVGNNISLGFCDCFCVIFISADNSDSSLGVVFSQQIKPSSRLAAALDLRKYHRNRVSCEASNFIGKYCTFQALSFFTFLDIKIELSQKVIETVFVF